MMEEREVRTVRQEDFCGTAEQAVLGGSIRYTACSSIGARDSQQDTLFVGEKGDSLLAVVCDGMGGMRGGEKASGLAVELLVGEFYRRAVADVPAFYREMAVFLDEKVYGLEENGRPMGAGSTIVSVLWKPEGLYWLSVGDSRIYLFRGGQMLCPVPGHNYLLLLNELLEAGKITPEKYERELPRSEALISFLGLGGIGRMEISPSPFRTEPRDRILLCSDGLYKSLSDERIRELLSLPLSPEIVAKGLVEEAVQAGGTRQDNTSVVLLQT